MSLSRKRFVLVFEFHDEEEVRIDNSSDEKHRIWNTPFVESLVELKEEEELDDDDNYADGMTIVIPLSKTIKRSSLIDFLDFLLYSAGDHKIGIGIHSQLTYRQVYKNHPGYYQWAHDHKDSCDDSQRYVDWVNFCRGGKRHPNPQEMVPIAKFFQIDVCARCGVLRLLSRQNFHPCRRTKWPRLPTNVPEFNSVTNGASDVHQAWKEAWEVAENDRKTSGRVVCCNDDLVCDDCFPCKRGCFECKEYECTSCENDSETITALKQWYDENPRISPKRKCPYSVQQIHLCPCCGKSVCQDCWKECQVCHRKACPRRCSSEVVMICPTCNRNRYYQNFKRSFFLCNLCTSEELSIYCGAGHRAVDRNAVRKRP